MFADKLQLTEKGLAKAGHLGSAACYPRQCWLKIYRRNHILQSCFGKVDVSGFSRRCWYFCLKSLTPIFTHQQRREKVYNMPERLIFIKYRIYPYRHIFVYLFSGCTVAASERTTWKNGKKYAAAMSK